VCFPLLPRGKFIGFHLCGAGLDCRIHNKNQMRNKITPPLRECKSTRSWFLQAYATWLTSCLPICLACVHEKEGGKEFERREKKEIIMKESENERTKIIGLPFPQSAGTRARSPSVSSPQSSRRPGAEKTRNARVLRTVTILNTRVVGPPNPAALKQHYPEGSTKRK
jgi:hypothetical protein